jgi:hypothetical protein
MVGSGPIIAHMFLFGKDSMIRSSPAPRGLGEWQAGTAYNIPMEGCRLVREEGLYSLTFSKGDRRSDVGRDRTFGAPSACPNDSSFFPLGA